MWTENEAQIKIKKIAPMAVFYKTPLCRNQASKSKFGPNHPLLRYFLDIICKYNELKIHHQNFLIRC
jgi:hypothetical protein